MMLAILGVLAGVAIAGDNSPPVTTDSVPTVTQPVTTTSDALPPVATVPSDPALVSLPGPGTPVQSLLFRPVRAKIVLVIKSARHWQSLLGRKTLHPVNIWALGSLQHASRILGHWQQRSHQLHLAARRMMRQSIMESRRTVQHWRLVAGIHPAVRTLASAQSGLEEEFAWWRQARRSVLQEAAHPPHLAQWLCIHHYEGAWNDAGGPYWGGLQMNMGFMSTYGGYLLRTKGTADHWTPLEQMWVAAKAETSRGFWPWPNTARDCGLLPR